ncbi:TBC1 domain, member 5 [Borealophlyctis nickersoniae]|nr:TBC1 domain, member 5 [Borealophlyctis nickersoniae]
MRTSSELRRGWEALFKDPLLSMDKVKAKGFTGAITDDDLRSLYWKIYLEYLPSLNPDAWPLILAKERQGYENLKKKYIFDPNKASENNDWTLNNPLSLAEESPWTQYFKDAELQKVIRQDVERTFPDQPIFRTSEVQSVMSDILFVWCKLNPDVSYRQGMHELLAPILLIVERDKLDPKEGRESLDPVMVATFDPKYVEHDSAVLFYRIMRSAKPWFEVGLDTPIRKPARGIKGSKYGEHRGEVENKPIPIIAVCRRVQNELLKVLDYELFQHLEKQGIEPQLYGLEFPIPELFHLWDGIFAEDPNLGLVEWVCVALLVYLRKDLVGSDYAMTMHRLMKFPSMDQLGTTVSQFIDSAKGLRQRYAQRALLLASNSGRPAQPTSQGQPIEPVARPSSSRRPHVPWLNHTDRQVFTPVPSPAAPSQEPRSPSSQRAYPPVSYPPVATGSPRDARRNSAGSGKQSASSPVPSPPLSPKSQPDAHKPDQVQVHMAHLTKQLQHYRERDRTLVKKIERTVGILRDILRTEEGVQVVRRAAEIEGVVAELVAVAGELKPPSISDGGGDNPAQAQIGKLEAESLVKGPTSAVGSDKATFDAMNAADKMESRNSQNDPTPAVPAQSVALAVNPTDALLIPKPSDSSSSPPNALATAPPGKPYPRWGSSAEIRNSPAPSPTISISSTSGSTTQGYFLGKPGGHNLPSAASTTSSASDSGSAVLRPNTPDPWATESTDGTEDEVLADVFEDPWADHGDGRTGGTGVGAGGRRKGSSSDIRHGTGAAGGDLQRKSNPPSLARVPPAQQTRAVEATAPVQAVEPVHSVSPTSPRTARTTLKSRDPLGAGFAVGGGGGLTVPQRSEVKVDPLLRS